MSAKSILLILARTMGVVTAALGAWAVYLNASSSTPETIALSPRRPTISTQQLREMASRAIASHSNRSDADTMKDHRAEHKRAVATKTLSTLIDISNSLRVIAQCTLHTSGLDREMTKLIEMPARCGPEEMPEECLWKFPLDENEDEGN
ncbi:uncharacterized protein FPRO_11566 [Fusarium proliferatum ET1]|uniref:Uncharacterized protein n=1 Tax=Fusarium proliferatum (strain ET1) TaxID=1227346 RepID=A0A1L7W0D3_FUSPR|nr:uncharacterized protein FPRO_11566 [Fusarium proliferatum ET1]CZR46119.1 uncharacterized protein FPRO_11566 [Fusarium proliferatum ET1]